MQIIKKTQDILREHRVVAAYVFGSQIEGHSDPMSDLDLGVLFREQRESIMEILSLQADLQGARTPSPSI
ncbi:MAG: nucleotidyltransferase domain-containing protein [Firmicutes bacterium]|nr:nucleotidyltransferase domain-containing protein [Bacillota bacterium]